MTREITNIIRFWMDYLLPPILRDSRIFMYPAFYLWYKGKNVSKLMDFKQNVEHMSEEEYVEYYRIHSPIAKPRATDLNVKSVDFVLKYIGENKNVKVLDVGTGNGYMLSRLKEAGFTDLTGCDIINRIDDPDIKFVEGNIEKLPFDDNEFDIVMSHHTVEHIVNSYKAVQELKRVAKDKLFATTPRQRYYKYTFDLHVNFYRQKIDLLNVMGMEDYVCIENDGDWSFVGYLNGKPEDQKADPALEQASNS